MRFTASMSTPTRRDQAGSAQTLADIGELLAGQPTLNVFIVGHTGNQGTYEYTMDLSRKRAEAVAAALAKSYKITPG